MINQTSLQQVIICSLLCLITVNANASLIIRPAPADEHSHNRRAGKTFSLYGHKDSTVQMITPDLKTHQLKAINGKLNFKPTGKDNYHVLIAKREHNKVNETAIRYVYSFGKPTGKSPSELTAFNKSELEIIPAPLPREHWHYKAGSQATFIVHFNGVPLPSANVSLSTSNASLLSSTTDTQGRVAFKLPDDFKQTLAGNRANKPAELLLHVKHHDKQNQYSTWLSADYRVNPAHWRDTNLGVMIAGSGFIFGVLLTGLGFRAKHAEKNKNRKVK